MRLASIIFILLCCSFIAGPGDKAVADFKLKDTNGTIVSLSNYPEAKGFVVVFTCNHCPFAKLYGKRFNDLDAKYKPLGVPLLAINSMDTIMYEEESFALMKKKAQEEGFSFPYLLDSSQEVARDFAAQVTPHVFIIWKDGGSWVIKYSGPIDDNGEHPELATSFVQKALDELLAGKPVSKPKIQPFGCKIFLRAKK